ncbi:putative DD41D transposase [Trichonephila clavipes]|nr:putative DD41D transposase [Trichonephila clavipes]
MCSGDALQAEHLTQVGKTLFPSLKSKFGGNHSGNESEEFVPTCCIEGKENQQYQTSRDDDRFGVVDEVLPFGMECTQIKSSFLQGLKKSEDATEYRSLSWHYFPRWRPIFNSCQVIYSQFGLAIHQNDHEARRRFVEWAQNEIAVVPDFQILFSDEAHFWLNDYVNKQNCHIWSEANTQVYVETPLHPEKLIVWCALWAGGIIGPYFFKNDEGHNVTVNGDRYRAMITNFFIPELNNHDVQELWFQQDGATCHTARATIDLLKDTFGGRLISRFGPVNWPPRSCDLTPLDYFLWGYVKSLVKSLVYADKPQTFDHLEDNIRRVIADIRPQMLEKVIENWTSRLDYIRASRGSHMPEIIFKIQQAWEDNLSTLNAEDNSLWRIAKAFRKKTSPISALNGPTGIAFSDTNKTEVLAHSLASQFQLNDIHNPHKDEIITSVVDAYLDSNTNNTDIIPPITHLKLFSSLKRLKLKSTREEMGSPIKCLKSPTPWYF